MTGVNAHAEKVSPYRKLNAADLEKLRSSKPERPCFRCESRDWCEHRPDPAAM